MIQKTVKNKTWRLYSNFLMEDKTTENKVFDTVRQYKGYKKKNRKRIVSENKVMEIEIIETVKYY